MILHSNVTGVESPFQVSPLARKLFSAVFLSSFWPDGNESHCGYALENS